MINNYIKIIDQLKEELLPWVDELEEDEIFNLGKNFMRFKFRTDDNLVYNKKINIPVCVMSLSSVVKKGCFIIQTLGYESVFMNVKVF